MSLPWYVPLEKAPSLKDTTSDEQPSLLKHYSNLKIHETPIEEVQTGLMCDIGIMNRDVAVIQRFIACGMTIAKLELVGLEPDDCAQLIQSIRQAVYNYSTDLNYIYPLALLMIIQGPTLVTGELKDGPKSVIEIHKNKTIRLSTKPRWKDSGTSECLYVRYDITKLHPGDKIFIDSVMPGEKIQLSVLEVGDCSVECRINVGGLIGSRMAVRVPKVPENYPSINGEGDSTSMSTITSNENSEKQIEQKDQIAWAVASDIDAILIPRCQYSSDVRLVKELLPENGKYLLIFASIETVQALDNIDSILKEADGIYLDRNNLSTDLPIEKIFIAQKMILAKCNGLGKPCICKAVLNEHIPTLCVSDIANLIIDGADVIYLELHFSDIPLKKLWPSHDSHRTATHCLAAASVICKEAEHMIWKPRIYGNLELMQSPLNEPSKAICVSAVELAMRSRASVIICTTSSGRTAKILSYVKPHCPIVAVSRTCHTARQLRFWRGVRAVHCFDVVKSNWNSEVEARILVAIDYCKAKRILHAGDPYVVLTATRRGVGYCDSLRLLYASARNVVIVE